MPTDLGPIDTKHDDLRSLRIDHSLRDGGGEPPTWSRRFILGGIAAVVLLGVAALAYRALASNTPEVEVVRATAEGSDAAGSTVQSFMTFLQNILGIDTTAAGDTAAGVSISGGVITVTASTVVTARRVQRHPARRNRLDNSSVRRTGLDSIPESTLETNGWLDLEHQQEKTLGRRGQLLELGGAAWA